MEQLASLLRSYTQGTLSPADAQVLRQLLHDPAQAEKTEALLATLIEEGSVAAADNSVDWELRAQAVLAMDAGVTIRRTRWRWMAAAAAVLLLIIAGTYLLPERRSGSVTVITDIMPGTQKAILTLSDGSAVQLDSAGRQTIRPGITQQGGQLIYEGKGKTVAYNTLSTQRGGQFSLRLPDGTQVWLNAASSLRYPTAFNGNERRVEVTGEAYFEVAPHAGKPFRVNVRGRADVEVLGTSFNVNAYDNEASLRTTLLEGAIRVNGTLLKPGQQAEITDKLSVADLQNAQQVIAWKNGLFNFKGLHLKEAMLQLERWYDIEVVYGKDVPDIKFYGELKRNLSLAEVLSALKDLGIHFKIEGRKLTVLPKP